MRWFLDVPEEDQLVIEELTRSSNPDRVVAIVGAAFLENRLGQKVKSYFIRDDQSFPRIFSSSGVLGSFGTHIEIGFMLGLYGAEVRAELKFITKIRNKFAHQAPSVGFDTAPVKDWIGNLRLMDRFRHPDRPEVFDGGAATANEAYVAPQPSFVPTNHRDKYVLSVSLLSGYIALAPSGAPRKPEF